MPRRRRSLWWTAAVVGAALGCGGDAGSGSAAPSSGPPTPVATFSRIQASVLNTSCAVSGCHVSATASQSGNLVLAPDVAYDNLVGATPTNLAAQRDGLKRIAPGSLDKSLLVQKLVLSLAATHSEYGNTMPVGAAPLTQGQVDFVKQWIQAGAPRTGVVADTTLLANKTAQPGSAFVPLAAPPAGQGFQVKADSFGVRANFERELFVYRPLSNANAIYVSRIQTSMRPLSHHFVLYAIDPTMAPGFPCTPQPNVVRDIRNPDGSMNLINMIPMACHVFIAGAMSQTSDYQFPAGTALKLPASMSIDVNVHYVNRTANEIPGEAFANLYTVPASSVVNVAQTLNLGNTSISLPPGKSTTLSKTFTMSQTTSIIMLTSHMHQLGTRFQIQIVGGSRDGEQVYDNTDWEHPQQITFAQPLVLQKGQGLKSIITWNNTTDHTVTFGLQSTDEMGIIFGYWY
jgi:hypothetical protein